MTANLKFSNFVYFPQLKHWIKSKPWVFIIFLGCADKHRNCGSWASKGFCQGQYEAYMKKNCQKSCNLCGGGGGGGAGGGGGGGGGEGGIVNILK